MMLPENELPLFERPAAATGMKGMMFRACEWGELSDRDNSSVLVHDRCGLGEESEQVGIGLSFLCYQI